MGNSCGSTDSKLLFASVAVRMFSFGWIAVILFLYLMELGFSNYEVGSLFTFTLIGDFFITLYLTTQAARHGRKNTLLLSALLKIGAGAVFAFSDNYWWLVVAGTFGVITPTGNDIGPFKAVEQSALSELSDKAVALANSDSVTQDERDKDRAVADSINWMTGYHALISSWAQALGALASGFAIVFLRHHYEYTPLAAYRFVCLGYTVFGVIMAAMFLGLSADVEIDNAHVATVRKGMWAKFGLRQESTKSTVIKLSALFVLDAFAGGFVMQTFITYWFHVRWGMDEDYLGMLLMGSNFLAGLSAMAAKPMTQRFGNVKTMVYTHFPSNVFLILVVFMPTRELAVIMLFIRFSISQMDVPARNAYVALVVAKDERDAAQGITNLVRSAGVALSPLFLSWLIADPTNRLKFAMPFVVSGAIKCLYDVLVWFAFTSAGGDDTPVGATKAAAPAPAAYKPVSTTDTSTTTDSKHEPTTGATKGGYQSV